ncbi:MAG: DUF2298 domain-containing protein, partial [Candidatus Shapirobacteria bacterium]|nr:DUF2298 domain-containing protein [Candidatus Shapirobacteria bacterium]
FLILKKQKIKDKWRIFIFEETLFFICLTVWSFIRGFQPEIHGLEKFMDFGFVNSLLRSQFFPPADMWLAGQNINYYYFGHLVTAVLTKLSGLDSAITYNLMIATLFGLSFTAAFSLEGNLISFVIRKTKYVKRNKNHYLLIIAGGLLSALILTLGGNFHPLYWFLTHHFSFINYWYPDATRFIVEQFGAADNTIHEFPIYSFVVADLHGHLLNLPFVLLFLGLVFSFLVNKKFTIGNIVFPALLLGIFYMTNAWDLPIYFLILGFTVLWSNYLNYGYDWKTISRTFFFIAGCLILTIIFTSPFIFNFKSITSGISLTDFHSPTWMLLVLWGFPLLITISFLLFLRKKTKSQLLVSDYFSLILLSVAWFLIIMPEVIYVKDIYIHSYQRANTMFKFTYQSFVMFSLSSGYIIFRILTSLKKYILKILFSLFFILCSIFIFVYPYFAIHSFYGFQKYQGLNGLVYLNNLYPADYEAILWLRENIKGQPAILEAVGESYTDFARVSANTGLPTILGWRVHEWLWRGSFDEPSKRTEDVKTIYETNNLEQTKELLNKYHISYVFIGNLERETYPQLEEVKFAKIGKRVFEKNQTIIYQLNP